MGAYMCQPPLPWGRGDVDPFSSRCAAQPTRPFIRRREGDEALHKGIDGGQKVALMEGGGWCIA